MRLRFRASAGWAWRLATLIVMGATWCGGGDRAVVAAPPSPQLPPLSTVSRSPRLPGKFVWADLVTDDVPAARKFYGELFGWTFLQFGGYLVAANQDRPLCGLFQKPRAKDRPQAKPQWFAYLSVVDVERAQRLVTKAGGQVLAAPMVYPKRGEQAVFRDPEGALFGVVKSSTGDPPDFLADPGDWIWIQLLTRDARQAAAFYQPLGRYEIVENTQANRLNDVVLTSQGYARATVRTIPAGRDQVQPAWLPYVRVPSVPTAVTKAQALGGKVLVAPRSEVLGGKIAVVADPTGAAIGLLEWDASWLKGGSQP